MPLTVTECIACSTPTREIVYGARHLRLCPACGIACIDPLPTDAERAEAYASAYSLTRDAGADRLAGEMSRHAMSSEQLALLADLMPAPAGAVSHASTAETLRPPRLLDIGCDHGFFLDAARRLGFDTLGVEPSRKARAYCERAGLRVVQSLDDLPSEFTTGVDAITMWHSLEHMAQPRSVLDGCMRRLRPGGTLAVRVPDFGSAWSRLLGARWLWFQPDFHSFHFTQVGVERLLSAAGFGSVSVRSRRASRWSDVRVQGALRRAFRERGLYRTPLRSRLATIPKYLSAVELYAIAKKPL